MPRCQNCGNSVPSYELLVVGDASVCSDCGRPRSVEDEMIEDKKRLVSFFLSEVSTLDNTIDHEIELEGEYGGLAIKFHTTFDTVRAFFTQRRENGRKKLQVVK